MARRCCALTLLVAVTGAVVLTTAAGSRRTRSSIDRADRITKNVDAYATIADDPSLTKVGAITRLPEVAVGKRLALMGLFSAQGYAVAGSPVDPGWGKDLLGYRVLRGRGREPGRGRRDRARRRRRPRRSVSMSAASSTSRRRAPHSGGVSTAACRPVDSPLCKAILLALNRDRIDLSQLQGPQIHLHVVGITRSLFEVGAASNVVFFNFLTPAFFRKYRTAMQWQSTVMVRYRAGVTDEQFEAALHKTVPGADAITDFGTFTSVSDALRSTAGVLANGLLVFAAVAALVGLVLISQVLARNADRGNADRAVLRVFGATRAERVVDACAPLVPVAVAGTLLAVLGAWVGSSWMPIGTARRAEFARGTRLRRHDPHRRRGRPGRGRPRHLGCGGALGRADACVRRELGGPGSRRGSRSAGSRRRPPRAWRRRSDAGAARFRCARPSPAPPSRWPG